MTVLLSDEDTGEELTYKIVGEDEADIKQGKISVSSPIARALIGKEEGDVGVVAAPGGDRELEMLNTFITKVAEQTQSGPSKEQAYILNKAQSAWKQDPLVQLEAQKVEVDTGPVPVLDARVQYTGFLQMGDTRLAIINGMDYEAGDQVEPGGFIIRRIFPDQVVLTPPGKKKKTMILPMEETE